MRSLLGTLIVIAGCSQAAPEPPPRARPMNLSVATLMQEYEANAADADAKFRGARVQLLGNVDCVHKAGLDDRRVVIRRPNEPSGSFAVHCYFDPFWDSVLDVLEPGDSFDNRHQLIGTLERDGEQLVLRQCAVEIHRR